MPALSLKYPECGNIDEHNVVHTDPARWRWSDEHTRLFKQLWGRDISYRRRQRYCRHCQTTFDTAEIDEKFLSYLVEEIDRLRNTAKWYRTHMPYFTEGPGAIALFRAVFGLERAHEQRCFELLAEIVDAVRKVVETLPSNAQMLIREHYGIRVGDVSDADSNTGSDPNIEEVLTMLRHPSRAASWRRPLGWSSSTERDEHSLSAARLHRHRSQIAGCRMTVEGGIANLVHCHRLRMRLP